MFAAILGIGALILLSFGVILALHPANGAHPRVTTDEAVFAFIAFYFLLLGLRFMVGSVGNGGGIFLGDLFASLALTYFWSMRRK
jgi:hypothetical protein